MKNDSNHIESSTKKSLEVISYIKTLLQCSSNSLGPPQAAEAETSNQFPKRLP